MITYTCDRCKLVHYDLGAGAPPWESVDRHLICRECLRELRVLLAVAGFWEREVAAEDNTEATG